MIEQKISRVLCVCRGNCDRSPFMAAVLEMFLRKAGHDVECTSAGILKSAENGGASPYAIEAAKRIGLDISKHKRHRLSAEYQGSLSSGLFVCVDDDVANAVAELGVNVNKIYNVHIQNPHPVQFQEDYDRTAEAIVAAMYRVVIRYFPV